MQNEIIGVAVASTLLLPGIVDLAARKSGCGPATPLELIIEIALAVLAVLGICAVLF